MSTPEEVTHVTLSFNRKLSDEEIEALRLKTDAVEALAASGGHHDHDHPKLL
jgi:hypothetical protein